MTLIAEGRAIPCCIDAEEDFAEKARYALRMLLVPLNLEPRWVSAGGEVGGLYYGFGEARPDAIQLRAAEGAPRFFAAGEPYDAQQAAWFDGQEGRLPILFTSESGQADLVASTFLWLSGWQEVVNAQRDLHGRVPYASSLPAMLNAAHRPVVDAYRTLLSHQLREGGIEFRQRTWSGSDWALCPTHDVDYLRKWRLGILYREFVQNLMLNRRNADLRRRIRRAAAAVQQLRGNDPYRAALRRMPEEVSRRDGSATYFIKAGGTDPHDVPYSLDDRFFQSWSHRVREKGFEIGLHPSYRSPNDAEMLKSESARLRDATGESIWSIRHHYLRFDPARTPQIHHALGLQIDSTLGFAEHEGFRRGTCMPFQLFDVENDRPLSTWEMPLAAMDSALFNRRELDANGAFEATRQLAVACRRYGGALVGLWHNMLGDELEARGWDAHFQKTLDYASEHGARITSLRDALRGWK